MVSCLWGLQASNGALSPIRRLEAPWFMKGVQAPRVGLVSPARCVLEGALKRYTLIHPASHECISQRKIYFLSRNK
jgi:hypothetical protein